MVRAVRIESARPQVAWETQCRKNSLVDRRHEDFASQVMYLQHDSSLIVTGMHHLYKVDALTGASIWRSQSLGSYTTLRPYPPTFLSHEQSLFAGYCGKVSKVDPANGRLIWRFKMNTGFVSPTVLAAHKNTIFAAAAGHLVALDLDGALLWRIQFSRSSGSPVTIVHNTRDSHPLLYIGHRGKIYVYNTESQTQVKEWRSGTKSFVTMHKRRGVLVVATPACIWALHPKSMETIWKQTLEGAGTTVALQVSLVRSEEIVIASIFHQGDRSSLFTFRLADGSARWSTLSLKAGLCNGSSSIIFHDGFIIVGSSGGYIQGLHASNKTQRFRTTFGRSWLSFATTSTSSDTHSAQPIMQEQAAALIRPN